MRRNRPEVTHQIHQAIAYELLRRVFWLCEKERDQVNMPQKGRDIVISGLFDEALDLFDRVAEVEKKEKQDDT